MRIDQNQNFLYSFSLKDDAVLSHLPDAAQASIEGNIVDVIYESFVTPADEDYLSARLLARKGLPRGFYWAASQAIEKYFKAFLLLRGKAVNNFKGHPINALYRAADAIDKTISEIDLTPHREINIGLHSKPYLETISLENFINRIELNGNPDNRYNAYGIDFDTNDVFALDSLIFRIRGKIGVPSIEYSFRRVDKDLISIFQDNNPYFSGATSKDYTKIPSPEFPMIRSMAVTKLEFLVKNKSNSHYTYALRWLSERMKLPRSAMP